jgi:cytochrome P450
MMSWVAAANRDPRTFTDPEQFNPDRSPNPHIAFGFGPHYCLGAPLAKLEGDIILEAITDRIETIEFETDELVPNPGATTYGLQRLPMRLHAR